MSNAAAVARARVHRHPMRVVTRRTGLSAELLRVWERRYRVVTPGRTQTGRRLYSDAEIERLRLLFRATLAGRSIGLIAKLSTPALVSLVRQDVEAEEASARADIAISHLPVAAESIANCLAAVQKLDATALEAVLRRAVVALSASEFLDDLVAPFLERVGALWLEGTLRPVHERLAATVVRRVLDGVTESASVPGATPHLLIATPVGQIHELGAMLAAAATAAEGWSVTYLGAGLSAEDIAEAAATLRVRAVGLSVVYPLNDRALGPELRRLRALLPRNVTLLVGGAASSSYGDLLDEIGAERVHDLAALRVQLRELARRLRPARTRRR